MNDRLDHLNRNSPQLELANPKTSSAVTDELLRL